MKNGKVPGHKQYVVICPGVMINLPIVPGLDVFNDILNISEGHNSLLVSLA